MLKFFTKNTEKYSISKQNVEMKQTFHNSEMNSERIILNIVFECSDPDTETKHWLDLVPNLGIISFTFAQT